MNFFKNIILTLLLIFSLFSCDNKLKNNNNENIQRNYKVGDLVFTLNDKFVVKGGYVENEFLALDFSLPTMTVYKYASKKRDRLRIIIEKIEYASLPSFDERQIILENTFGARLSFEQKYHNLDFYKTTQTDYFDYFVSNNPYMPIRISCDRDKRKAVRSPQCHFDTVAMSQKVTLVYFYPKSFLNDWQIIHNQIINKLKTHMKKEN